jgi:hypothetical protein
MSLQFSAGFLTNALRPEFTIPSMETDHRDAEPKTKVPEAKPKVRFGHVVSWRAEPLGQTQRPPVEPTDQSATKPLE